MRRLRSAHSGTIFSYILRESLFSFFIAFLFYFFLFFINFIIVYIEELLGNNLEPLEIFELLLWAIPNLLFLTFPFAALQGALMTATHLGATNEIQGFQSIGIPYRRILYPFVLGSVLVMGLNFYVADYLIPEFSHQFRLSAARIVKEKPLFALESYSSQTFGDVKLITGAIDEDTITPITIQLPTDDGQRLVTAARARVNTEDGAYQLLRLEMEEVVIHTVPINNPENYDTITADTVEYNLNIDTTIPIAVGSSITDLNISQLLEKVEGLEASHEARVYEHNIQGAKLIHSMLHDYFYDYSSGLGFYNQIGTRISQYRTYLQNEPFDREIQNTWLEIHKKVSIPFACVALTIFAFPFAFMKNKEGRARGFMIGIFFSLVYWVMLLGGNTLSLRTTVSPAISMWAPDFIILGLGLFFLYKRSRV